ncbi:MAG TPA: ATP-binding protein, partial [Streptomyces sp.]|nr:ATP-binding protein [Streptomyces sp.]
GVLEALAETAATALGAPNWAVAPALRLLPGWGEDWAGLRVRRRIARIRREGGGGPVNDFVVTLNRLYHENERTERREAEEVLFDAFLTDLERAYLTRRGDHDRTSNCLLLLDNADSALGDDVLDLLLRARDKPGVTAPLLTLATAAGRPEALVRREPGGAPRPGAYLACWAQPHRFAPVPVDDLLAVAQLRDLDVREVSQIAETVLRTAPPGSELPETDDGVRWLGWLVHQLTHGHPAATAAVFEALREFAPQTPWDERLRRLFTPELVARLLDRLLPADTTPELRAMLARAAAAVNLGQAGAASELWRDAGEAVGGHFARFSGDPLHTMHVTTGDPRSDGGDETPHPLLRFLLLRELAAQDGDFQAWDAAHSAMRLRATARVESGHPHEEPLVAYHELAAGHLQAAVDYLDTRFGVLPAEEWCTELCMLRRAPVRTPGGALPMSPRRHFDDLVAFLGEPGRPRSRRTKAVARLLAASWISPEPRDDPATDGVGDPYRNPLGDPYAELYAEISEEFLVLRGLVDDGTDRHVFLQKSEQYRRKPWW